MDDEECIKSAETYLDGIWYGDVLYAYAEEQQGDRVFVVTREELVDLGARLSKEEDAYSRWCGESSATTITVNDVIQGFRLTASSNLQRFREQRHIAHDFHTCALLDLRLDALMEELPEAISNTGRNSATL